MVFHEPYSIILISSNFPKNVNFLWLKIKFPDFSLTLENFFPLTISWPVATLIKAAMILQAFIHLVIIIY